jgi:PAS domain S-box-containing protein
MMPGGDLRGLLETNGAPAFALEARAGCGFVVVAANARHKRLTGLADDAVIGRMPGEFLPPEEAGGPLEAACRRCEASGAAVEFEGARTLRHGTAWCRTVLVPDGMKDGCVRIFTTLIELPGRRHAEPMPRAADHELEAIFEAANVGILLVDAGTGRILTANPHVRRLLGHPVGSLAGTALEAIVAAGDAPGLERRRARACVGLVERHSSEYRMRRHDGGEFLGEVTGSFIREAGSGRMLWAVTVGIRRRPACFSSGSPMPWRPATTVSHCTTSTTGWSSATTPSPPSTAGRPANCRAAASRTCSGMPGGSVPVRASDPRSTPPGWPAGSGTTTERTAPPSSRRPGTTAGS